MFRKNFECQKQFMFEFRNVKLQKSARGGFYYFFNKLKFASDSKREYCLNGK